MEVYREDLLEPQDPTTKRVTGLNGLPRVAGMTESTATPYRQRIRRTARRLVNTRVLPLKY